MLHTLIDTNLKLLLFNEIHLNSKYNTKKYNIYFNKNFYYYIYGLRSNKISLYNLNLTLYFLNKLKYFYISIFIANENILILNTIKLNSNIHGKLNQMLYDINQTNQIKIFNNKKWTSGLLTNFKMIMQENSKLLPFNFIPVHLIIDNFADFKFAIYECLKLNIPTLGFLSSLQREPEAFTYLLPGHFLGQQFYIFFIFQLYLWSLMINYNNLINKKNEINENEIN